MNFIQELAVEIWDSSHFKDDYANLVKNSIRLEFFDDKKENYTGSGVIDLSAFHVLCNQP